MFILSYILSTFVLRYWPILKKSHNFHEKEDNLSLPVVDFPTYKIIYIFIRVRKH